MVTYEEIEGDIYKTTKYKSDIIHPLSELKEQQLLINTMLGLIADISNGIINNGTIGTAKEIVRNVRTNLWKD